MLDRSRGEWGEPADDTATMSINYLFFSILKAGRLDGDLESMFRLFWDNYLEKSRDREMLDVIAPFYAWRGLVIASPVWYPHLQTSVRKMLFNFIENVLAADRFDPADVKRYLTMKMQEGFALWLTGLPASGKSSITRETGGTAESTGPDRDRARIRCNAQDPDSRTGLHR